MSRSLEPDQKKLYSSSFLQFYQPVGNITPKIPVLESRGDRPLKMTFDDQLKMLVLTTSAVTLSKNTLLMALQKTSSHSLPKFPTCL